MVLGKDEMMGLLLDACPSFTPQWQAFLDEWQDNTDDLPLYLALTDFARHLVGMLDRDETANFPAVFAVVERLHLEGDSYVRTAATVGLLEDLQNRHFHIRTQPDQFRPFLGAATAKWWDKLYRFWDHGEVLTED